MRSVNSVMHSSHYVLFVCALFMRYFYVYLLFFELFLCSFYALFMLFLFLCALFIFICSFLCSFYENFLCAISMRSFIVPFVFAFYMSSFYVFFLCAPFMWSFVVLFVFTPFMRSFCVLFMCSFYVFFFFALFVFALFMCSFYAFFLFAFFMRSFGLTDRNAIMPLNREFNWRFIFSKRNIQYFMYVRKNSSKTYGRARQEFFQCFWWPATFWCFSTNKQLSILWWNYPERSFERERNNHSAMPI